MIRENRQSVANAPVESEKSPVEVQECRKITDHFRGIYRIYHPNLTKEYRRMSTCNRLDLQTLESQPVIMPKNFPDHCFESEWTSVCGLTYRVLPSLGKHDQIRQGCTRDVWTIPDLRTPDGLPPFQVLLPFCVEVWLHNIPQRSTLILWAFEYTSRVLEKLHNEIPIELPPSSHCYIHWAHITK